MTVLIVEDDELNKMVIEEMVRMLYPECRVLTAENGEEALRIVDNGSMDVILSDINMPVMDGYELVREVRTVRKLGIPMISITAAALIGDRERLLQSGYNDYISKPIDFSLFSKVLENYCR